MGMLSGLGSSTASMQSSLSNVSQLFQNEGQREGSGWTRGLLGSMIFRHAVSSWSYNRMQLWSFSVHCHLKSQKYACHKKYELLEILINYYINC